MTASPFASSAVRPTVVISRCIDFDSCRYNGQVIRASLREELEPHMTLLPICPELEIGLGVPRDPVRLVAGPRADSVAGSQAKKRMVQPSTSRDLTEPMNRFSARYLAAVGDVDGFILKGRSPSCGIRDAKIYAGEAAAGEHAAPIGKGPGLFAAAVLERFPDTAIEDEGRLNDLRLRDHFLTKLFALAGARRVASEGTMGALVEFHSRNKLLLTAYNQTRARALGRIVANPEREPFESAASRYREELSAALARPPRERSNVNVLMHALGHVSDHLTPAERAHFLDSLEAYRSGRLPLIAVQSVLGSWVARFDVEYLRDQTYFAPFPAELVRLPATDGRQRRRRMAGAS